MAQCAAKSKRSGEQCKRHAALGCSVCNIHGGKSRTGVASGTYKTGERSKFFPTRLAARFEAARANPDLVSHRDDIATADVRLNELLERVGDDDPRVLWGRARAALEAYTEAAERGSRTQTTARTVLEGVISEGLSNPTGATWREILNLLEQRRKLVESESKRQQMLQQMIPTESALLLIGLIERIVKKYVTEPAQLAAIGRELIQLAAVPAGRIIDAERE